jgi:hypothetical protein
MGYAISAGLGASISDRVGMPVWAAVVCSLVACVTGGAFAGLAYGRDSGVDADDLGIHLVPARPGGLVPWQRVVDLRAERRGARTVVAVYAESGSVTRLRAPYDGQLLASDPEFERKLFMLRNLWETHRTFDLHAE